MAVREVAIPLADGTETAGLLQQPAVCHAALVLGHGAGAGMRHRFMAAAADALATCGIATLRFDFPYMHHGRKVPDRAPVAEAAVRAAVTAAAGMLPGVTLFAGGKSFGGRMTSQAQAAAALPGVRGLVFLGFPLHPAGKPDVARAVHLAQVDVPMLFIGGTNDALAEWSLLEPMVAGLGARAELLRLDGADHSFHVPAKSGRKDHEVLHGAMQAAAAWMLAVAGTSPEAAGHS